MRTVRTVTYFWLLELLAFSLAVVQMLGGIRTDEAKYLLSIPYPHPPLMRSLMLWTSSLPLHEFLWRFLIASLCVQAVWIIADFGDVLPRVRQRALTIAWLLSSAVLLQAGTISMAVFSALFGLVFLWFALHPDPSRSPSFLALLWLASLFTGYQSVLFAPLVLSGLLKLQTTRTRALLYFVVPLLLLALYSFTNPLALASMVTVSSQDGSMAILQRFARIGWIWLVGGSAVLSLAGTFGILSSNRLDLVATLGLVAGYIVLTSQHYYAILFTPLFIGGVYILFCRRRLYTSLFLSVEAVCTAVILFLAFPVMTPTPARAVMARLQARGIDGPVLLDGSFGHEWQYESFVPVLRFSSRLSLEAEATAQVFVCTKIACDADVNLEEWTRLPDMPMPTWIRR